MSKQDVLNLIDKNQANLTENRNNLIEMTELLEAWSDGNGGGTDPEYWPKYSREEKDRVHALPWHGKYAIHMMGLPGFIYRNLKIDRKKTIDTVFELIRLAREDGARYIRTFMMNGSRRASERYMKKALPWVTLPGGRIDFSQRNDYYFQCCEVIERACKTWHCIHRPTFYMDRYNYDIFRAVNNVQGIEGFRSAGAQAVKIKFMCDYIKFQKNDLHNNSRSTFEIENEPAHHGDHQLGFLMADQNLEMFRAVEALDLGTRINEVWTCSGMSEFQHANFVGRHYAFGRWFGADEFRTRKVHPEWHGMSTLDSIQDDLIAGLGSGWRHLAYNSDGANVGSYNPIPWTNFRQASYDELVEMFTFAIMQSHDRGKDFYFTCFAMDCLQQDPIDNVAKETYDLSKMDWSTDNYRGRYSAYRDVVADLGYS